ncbi:DUF4114 domain-containing protein [Nostoc sp.]|uniref:DUF4114 domain-containing protein n=1 Tax=Nostoc sp. TaxID=1180 RepID=UPI002FF47285
MKATLLTALIAATATLTGLVAKVETASAAGFTWNNAWTQPTISSGFNADPFQKFVQQEGIALPNSGQVKLDPSKLNLKYDYNVSVDFINEGASYRNQLAFNATGTTNKSGLLFKDASCDESKCIMSGASSGLKIGDGVNIGTITGGTQLDLFLKANGLNNSNGNIFGTQTASNADGLQHVVAYAYNNYIILGFEDLYGALHGTGSLDQNSDRDFNDLVVVLDIGEANVRELISATVPEPSVTLSMFALGAVSMFGLRRRQTRTSN